MGLYEEHCLPLVVNLACSTAMVGRLRAEVVPLAEGRVLEVGMGGGLNLPHYDPDKVSCVCGVEPSEAMRKKAARVIGKAGIPVELVEANAEEITFEDDSFDTAVLTFTLCTIPDWRAALLQIRRVLKPGGRLIFCEHGLAPDQGVQRWQHRINPYWRAVAGGCNLDRPIADMIEQAGLGIETLTARYVPGAPKLAAFVYSGTARKR